jgi:hypothetical protein
VGHDSGGVLEALIDVADLPSKLANGVTAGGAFTYAKQIQMKGQVLGNNVIDDGTFGFIVDPSNRDELGLRVRELASKTHLLRHHRFVFLGAVCNS